MRARRTRCRREPGEEKEPRGTSEEGERREEAGMPRTMLCTVRAKREGEGGGTKPTHKGV